MQGIINVDDWYKRKSYWIDLVSQLISSNVEHCLGVERDFRSHHVKVSSFLW